MGMFTHKPIKSENAFPSHTSSFHQQINESWFIVFSSFARSQSPASSGSLQTSSYLCRYHSDRTVCLQTKQSLLHRHEGVRIKPKQRRQRHSMPSPGPE